MPGVMVLFPSEWCDTGSQTWTGHIFRVVNWFQLSISRCHIPTQAKGLVIERRKIVADWETHLIDHHNLTS